MLNPSFSPAQDTPTGSRQPAVHPAVAVRVVVPAARVGRVNVGELKVSFAIPGIVLVLTGINGRASISDAVPMLVPR